MNSLLPTLGNCRRGSLTNPMFITGFYLIPTEDHRGPCSEVGSQGPAKHLVGFELGPPVVNVTP